MVTPFQRFPDGNPLKYIKRAALPGRTRSCGDLQSTIAPRGIVRYTPPMVKIRSWFVVALFLARYVLSRFKLARRPSVVNLYPEAQDVLGWSLGMHKYLHVVGAEHYPPSMPAVFCGNHHKLDDPLMIFRGVFLASRETMHLRFMMRGDYFVGPLFQNPFIEGEEFFSCVGAYSIDRDRVSLARLKPFLKILEEDSAFLMFPGRTRSRSGLFIEYRDNVQEPGGVSFFLRQTQRRRPGTHVAAVPVVRNFNPVSKRTAIVLGPPLYLAPDADKGGQRDFDARLIVVMSGLVELNVPQILSAILYVRCLHGLNDPLSLGALAQAVENVFTRTRHPYLDPEDTADLTKAVARTTRYLQKAGAVTRQGNGVQPVAEAILSVPELDNHYRKRNAVKFLTNQILHLDEVTALIDEEARFSGTRTGAAV